MAFRSGRSCAPPRTVLVVGASGALGTRFLALTTGNARPAPKRLAWLARAATGRAPYRMRTEADIDLRRRGSLRHWLSLSPDAVVYLAGVPAFLAKEKPELSRRVHLDRFLDVLRWATKGPKRQRVVYASSTAAAADAGPYGTHKRAAERALLVSRAAGTALRFPMLLPRPAGATSPSAFVDQALEAVRHGLPYSWPVPLDRRVLAMSIGAAARHLGVALRRKTTAPLVLQLPATPVSARALCDAVDAPDHCRAVDLDPALDQAIARRTVHTSRIRAAGCGFAHGEALRTLIREAAVPDPSRRLARPIAPGGALRTADTAGCDPGRHPTPAILDDEPPKHRRRNSASACHSPAPRPSPTPEF